MGQKYTTVHLNNGLDAKNTHKPFGQSMNFTFVPDVVVSNGGGGGGSNGVMEEGDRLITVDLRDESPGTSESGESETRLTEDVTPATGPETEMVDFDGRQKKPLKKRPVLTVSWSRTLSNPSFIIQEGKVNISWGSAVLHALKGMCKG